jgi:hypothetical protein
MLLEDNGVGPFIIAALPAGNDCFVAANPVLLIKLDTAQVSIEPPAPVIRRTKEQENTTKMNSSLNRPLSHIRSRRHMI